jgi:hypothetical protein
VLLDGAVELAFGAVGVTATDHACSSAILSFRLDLFVNRRFCSTGRLEGDSESPILQRTMGEAVRQLARRDFRARLIRDLATYVVELLAVGTVYFVLAKIGLALASINLSASAIWPATGFALASMLVRGYRVGPAILVASFAANVTNAGSVYTSAAIAAGNMLEALAAAWLINLWSNGRETFETPADVVKFALVCLLPSTIISPTLGVGSLTLTGYADSSAFASIWMTWWLGERSRRPGLCSLRRLVGHNRSAVLRALPVARDGRSRGGGDRCWCRRIQPAHRTDDIPRCVGVPCDPAAVVGSAAMRPARHRDRRRHSLVLCRVGDNGGRRPLRAG